jgi:hypothetical protein
MRKPLNTMHAAALLGAAAVLLSAIAVPSAQIRRDTTSWGAPVATNAIVQQPEAYYGKLVTLSAGVEQVLSKTAFVVDQRKAVSATETKALGKPILVIFPYLTGSLDQKNYLLMRGEIVKFDTAAVAKVAADYKLDLAPELIAKYQGQPVLVANLIIDSTTNVLGRKPLPAPSAVDNSLTAAMKTISPAATALRTAVDESKADVVAQNVAKLGPAFSEIETIWEDLGQVAAAEWAREARGHAASIQRDAAAGNWDAVKKSAAALTTVCGTCHGVYRERQEDGTFRIKPGTI